MKYFELSKEEKELLKEVEKGKFVRVKDFENEKQKVLDAARNTLNKAKNINIRLSQKDLQKLKARAVEIGIPYQTLVSSVIHRFVSREKAFDLS